LPREPGGTTKVPFRGRRFPAATIHYVISS
jgi:hypothetical protein